MTDDDRHHPWFAPLWRRLLLVAVCFTIAAADLYFGNFGWALVFGGIGAYGVWVFFIAWDRDDDP